jgi:hypothetical protein
MDALVYYTTLRIGRFMPKIENKDSLHAEFVDRFS